MNAATMWNAFGGSPGQRPGDDSGEVAPSATAKGIDRNAGSETAQQLEHFAVIYNRHRESLGSPQQRCRFAMTISRSVIQTLKTQIRKSRASIWSQNALTSRFRQIVSIRHVLQPIDLLAV